VAVGMVGAVLGGFGHNWVHQPAYRNWALLSLDTVGFSSEAWLREHLMQHHMYTNTPADNHFKGTDPWFITDPTVERNLLQRYVTPYLNPLLLSVGVFANYVTHTVFMLQGQENLSIGKLILPCQMALLISNWGLAHGLLLAWLIFGTTSVWYFTVALMNHNAEHCTDIKERNASKDWGVAQLNSSADFGTGLSFLSSMKYLWLNYHTVHHMFPHTDMSKHPGIQAILVDTAKEFGIKYRTSNASALYWEMLRSFAHPASLFEEINVYAGGI
jgi:fatty acid desaturase